MAPPISAVVTQDVTCHALLLALAATQLRRAWHAGVIDSDTAMRSLDSVIGEICHVRATKGDHASCRSSVQGRPADTPHDEGCA
jgi:hypothetical protein